MENVAKSLIPELTLLSSYDLNLLQFIAEYVEVVSVDQNSSVPFKTVFRYYKKFMLTQDQKPLTYNKFRLEFQTILTEGLSKEISVIKKNKIWFVNNIRLIDPTILKNLYKHFYSLK